MITNFKIFERNTPQIDDWAVVKLDKEEYSTLKSDAAMIFYDFVTHTPGKVMPINLTREDLVYLDYKNIPKEINNWFVFGGRSYHLYEIEFFSTDKETVDAYINSNKYNL